MKRAGLVAVLVLAIAPAAMAKGEPRLTAAQAQDAVVAYNQRIVDHGDQQSFKVVRCRRVSRREYGCRVLYWGATAEIDGEPTPADGWSVDHARRVSKCKVRTWTPDWVGHRDIRLCR